MNKLVKKYDRQGPRYTSYPPVPFWKGAPTHFRWRDHLQKSYHHEQGVDVYIHVPFCDSICHYCGCNRIKSDDSKLRDEYVDLLIKEWRRYPQMKINSIHFGGGTPSLLSVENFEKLFNVFEDDLKEDFIGSIELNPRLTSKEHLQLFKDWGIERVSIGVQDLNDQVLHAVNRRLTVKEIIDFYRVIRSFKFQSVNFDLIYGLPFQSEESMNKTLELVGELSPDVLAFYGYAHVPWKSDNQTNIVESTLPNASLKSRLFNMGKEFLLQRGYLAIGLDHFALPESFLGTAFTQKRLRRNFMGYTDRKSNITIGLGVSSISNSPLSFAQNPKTISQYQSFVAEEQPQFEAGHVLSSQDIVASRIIHDLMCNGEAVIDVEITDFIKKSLVEMADDGLVKMANNLLQVTPSGMPFVRNVAMLFDPYLEGAQVQNQFSRTV